VRGRDRRDGFEPHIEGGLGPNTSGARHGESVPRAASGFTSDTCCEPNRALFIEKPFGRPALEDRHCGVGFARMSWNAF